ncbi:MAG: protein O-mannosyl-transferase family [Anaerolineae bacterium]
MGILVLLPIYLLTMPPSLTWAHWGADGGDLATAVALGRLPHPPGFPTYLLLGAAFVRLPWGDPAGRLNRLSALSAALAAGLTAAAVRRVSSSAVAEKGGQPQGLPLQNLAVAAVTAGLSLGLAPLFWSQALIAEVYAPAALFSAALLFLACGAGFQPVLTGILWGLGIGVHPTLLFLAPLVWWRKIYLAHPFALLTVVILYGPVLLAWGKTPSPWADFSTLDGWWAYVSGRLYHGYLFGLPAAFWPQRLLAWAGLLARQFTPPGALLALWGWARLWRENRGLAVATALAFGAFSLYAVAYNTADSLVYLAPALPLVALWLGAGLDALLRASWSVLHAPRPLLPAICFLLPAIQAVLFWGQMDLHRDRSAITWAGETLRAAPPGAVLLTDQDGATFALWYARDVLRVRPDVRIVDRDLLGHPPYRRFLGVEWGLDCGAGCQPATPGSLETALNDPTRPIIPVHAPLEGGR